MTPDKTMNGSLETLPSGVGREVARIARRLAVLTGRPGGEVEISLTLRRRPLDDDGREGCWIEMRSDLAWPRNGLRSILGPLEQDYEWHPRRSAAVFAAPDHELRMRIREAFPQGWKVTLDARWSPNEKGWSI